MLCYIFAQRLKRGVELLFIGIKISSQIYRREMKPSILFSSYPSSDNNNQPGCTPDFFFFLVVNLP